MGVGIVSIDLHLAGVASASRGPLAIAMVAWVPLGLLLTGRLVGDRMRFAGEAGPPASLTVGAATAVLGARPATSVVVLAAALRRPIPLLRTGGAQPPRASGEPAES